MQRELFGGAVSCMLPASYIDISTVRPVPDNQEVWNDVHLDRTVIVELLEREQKADGQVLEYVLNDLLEYQDAVRLETSVSIITNTIDIPGCRAGSMPCFSQCGSVVALVSKYKEAARNEVLILAAVIRLEQAGTDVLITHNIPLYIAPGSSSSAAAAGSSAASATASAEEDQHQEQRDERKKATRQAEEKAFVDMVSTFTVHDWSLFTDDVPGS